MERFQFLQQHHMQSRLAGSDGNAPCFQAAASGQLLLGSTDMLTSYSHMFIKPLSLWRQSDALAGTKQQTASQFLLQLVHTAGNVRLVAAQDIGRFCQALIFGDIIKNTIILIVCSHTVTTHVNLIYSIYQQYILHLGRPTV